MTEYAMTAHEHVRITRRDAEALVAEVRWTPAATKPPAHRHPEQDEHFAVLEGTLRVRVGREERLVGPGEELDVPRGTVHAMAPAGEHPVRAVWTVRPALGTEALWAGLDAANRRHDGAPPLPALARVLKAHPREFRLGLPDPLAGIVVAVLARLPVRG